MSLILFAQSRRGAVPALARSLGVTPAFLWQCATGRRKVPPRLCPRIEKLTTGQLKVEELRGDRTWTRVPDPAWPHPGGRPLLDDAAQ